MKNLIILICTLTLSVSAIAQTATELRPFWAERTPTPPYGANYFLAWGMGEGGNEETAINAAWADALQKSLHELGVVGITQQDINAVATGGINAVVKFNRMKRRVVSATEPIRLSANRMKIYILIQVQRNVNGADDFYSLNTNQFEDESFKRRMKEFNGAMTGRYPFSARVFVPGMAQLHKGSTAKGWLFIAAEAACIGGIVAAECLRASYDSKVKSTHNANLIKDYANTRDNWCNIRNGAIAGAAAIYVWNIIDGIAAKGKRRHFAVGDTRLRMSPYVTDNSGGLSVCLNF